MRLAIMQPYFFPYIGYWQLLNAADRFVIYDDVNFIKQGWINRNRLLLGGEPSYITVPLDGASPNKRICDIAVQRSPHWRRKMLASIEQGYRKSPCFAEIFPEVDSLIRFEMNNLADFLAHQLVKMAKLLGIDTEIIVTSGDYQNCELSGQERVLDICGREGATSYINLPGGQKLYDPESFKAANLDLHFLSTRASPYQQRGADFVPNLSVIDALMEVGAAGVRSRLEEYDLLAADELLPRTEAAG